jgi:ufm1-conjugating enzyme 1
VTYPTTAPEIALPELDGKTAKMYRGGKICLTDHFKPLWARNVPKFGIAHAMALGVSCIFRFYIAVLNVVTLIMKLEVKI